MQKERFGEVDGRPVTRYTFGGEDLKVSVLDFGAVVHRLIVDGTDVILGYERGEDYSFRGGCLGADIGRVANRIARAQFSLNGFTYHLTQNSGKNHIHGGKNPFHRKFFDVEELENGIRMTCFSPDGEEGYPGNLTHTVTYLVEDRTLKILMEAQSDQDTIWGPTSHIYFNLNGDVGNAVTNELAIYADGYTPVDEELIPLGEVAPVRGTAYDFTVMKPVERDLAQIGGYDINYVLNGSHAATMRGDRSGLRMDVYTDLPCMQVYSGVKDLGGAPGKTRPYHDREGIALEPQYAPNAINMPGFRQPVLRAGEKKSHYILLSFAEPGQEE